MIQHLILLKLQNMMDINVNLLKWSINFLIKKTSGSGIKNENMSNKELAEDNKNQLLELLREEKYTHVL